ncbi:eukaryotic translation initiation factor 1A, Y-chromosomal, putative [Entamoeba invadens IP1]|uniref:Eukaryotic translation initiation factor 1A, Y-chromosomal, putative n=1 Tax=Entamoeba invadens IP1 TaxID=370355 RepID=A0A0A1UBX1_ENTIV|nr:eukaryotic translation initiation factor 1A, Y-chromosomal, putative [Entamoeba invadens IP1]ELP92711.1 eukaryotic translation initiation factor 1A, Y-chromosomal, putative [Entamoeba invadens IP1]|eukprot:XP_004259482.1 eukaryotic translation initiation factor 1A, Y-chromosomal, putative [Entamoeba invadens IP1]
MPRAKGKGGKRGGRRGGMSSEGRELEFKEVGQVYAQVTRILGNRRIEAYCFDGKQRLCHIRGQMQRKVWISVGDVVLVSLREYEEDKADVIKKYNADEVIQLKKYKELPERLQTEEVGQKKDVNIRFGVGDKVSDDSDAGDFDDEEKEDDDEDSQDDLPPPQNRVYTLDDL